MAERVSLFLTLFILTATTEVSFAQECSNVHVINSWNTGQTAYIEFQVDHEVHGWYLTLTFDRDFESFDPYQAATIVSGGSNTDFVELHNVQWDADYPLGSTFRFDYQVHHADGSPKPNVIAAVLDSQDVCSGSGGNLLITVLAGFNEFGFNESSRFNESVFYLKYFFT